MKHGMDLTEQKKSSCENKSSRLCAAPWLCMSLKKGFEQPVKQRLQPQSTEWHYIFTVTFLKPKICLIVQTATIRKAKPVMAKAMQRKLTSTTRRRTPTLNAPMWRTTPTNQRATPAIQAGHPARDARKHRAVAWTIDIEESEIRKAVWSEKPLCH